jgi:dihydromethanopterin reductase
VSSCSAPDVSFSPGFSHEDRAVVETRSTEQPADVIARYPERVIYIGGGV